MKETRIQSIVLAVLALLFGSFMLFGRGSVKDAMELTDALNRQVDSLKVLTRNYEKIHREYVVLYGELSETRNKVETLKGKLDEISKSNLSSVSKIKQELNAVLDEYDSLDLRLTPLTPTDDLTFE